MAKQAKRHMDLNVQGDLVTSSPLMFRNRIINGNFDIWQRGTSFSSIAAYTYTADRWLSDGAVTSVARSGTQNNVMTVVTQAGTGMAQRIETAGGGFLAGQTYTISGLVNASVANLTVTVTYRAGNTFKATIHTADVSSQLTAGSYSRFTTTLTLANAPTDFAGTDCIQVSFTSSVVNTINFQNVQFESGSSATPFERRPIGMELQLCQRYYEQNSSLDTGIWWNGNATNGVTYYYSEKFKVTKRGVPGITLVNSESAGFGAITIGVTTIDGFRTQSGATITGNSQYFRTGWKADAEL